jgi:hypothetical protein
MYATVIGAMGGVIIIVIAFLKAYRWYRSHKPWVMKYVTKNIHSPKGDIGELDKLILNCTDKTEFTVRLKVKYPTDFGRIALRPKLKKWKLSRGYIWQWKNVPKDSAIRVLDTNDDTSQRVTQKVSFRTCKDDLCGIYIDYEPKLGLVAGSQLNLKVEMAIPEPWDGYIEVYNEPPGGYRQITRRKLTIK